VTEAVADRKAVRRFVRIRQDVEPMDPREWGNLGTMVCWHRRYVLGDEQSEEDPERWLCDLVGVDQLELEEWWTARHKVDWQKLYSDEYSEKMKACEVWVRERIQREVERQLIILPLYLYDHSGITMNTIGFSCPWDSGQIGWIYVKKDQVRKEYGWKTITAQRRKQVEDYLRHEVETYDMWLRNDVYGFEVVEVYECDLGHEHEKVTDSCWGFFGDDWNENGIKDHLPDELQDHEKWEMPW